MIEEADRDGDGEVSQQEFLRIMKKTCLYWISRRFMNDWINEAVIWAHDKSSTSFAKIRKCTIEFKDQLNVKRGHVNEHWQYKAFGKLVRDIRVLL